jgi:transketolase
MAKADPRLVLLTGDHGYALFDEFRQACPGQYINAGIAEQNMVGVAAGLARTGFRPYVYGLSAFVPIRVLEQIKLDLAHDSLPVVLIGDGAGFVYSHLGTSHQSTEDIAATRAIPNLHVYSPADRFELEHCLELSTKTATTIYLRMGKADRGDVHSAPIHSNLGDLLQVRTGVGDISLIATGSMVRTAMDIADHAFPNSAVWSVPFIKPADPTQITAICRRSRIIAVLEEHSVNGGLGSSIAEIASEYAPTKIIRIGVQDRYSEACGTYDYLLTEHGLDKKSVEQKILQFSESH